jgi:tRNA threonylcarbamoyladenosine biosynthesis protein TsaE
MVSRFPETLSDHVVRDLPDEASTGRLAAAVARLARAGDAILLEGPLGAGKTTFARAFLRAYFRDPSLEVPSPTFTLVQSYGGLEEARVHHFDLWRTGGPAALVELGFEDALGDIVLVEWPDRLGELRPEQALSVSLSLAEGGRRRVVLEGWPDRLEELA